MIFVYKLDKKRLKRKLTNVSGRANALLLFGKEAKLKYKEIKKYKFIKEYFCDIDRLVNAIAEYHRVANIQNDEKTIWDLLRTSSR